MRFAPFLTKRVAPLKGRVGFVPVLCATTALIVVAILAFPNVPAAQTNAPAAPAAAPAPDAAQARASVVKTEASSFDVWTVVCNTLSQPAGAKKCLARLPVNSETTHQPIVNLLVGPNAKGEMRFDVQIPTSTSIPEGVTLKFDNGEEVKLPIAMCDPTSCLASLPYGGKLPALLGGAKVSASWVSLSAGLVKVDFPLKGSKEALIALAQSMPKSPAATLRPTSDQ